MKPAYKCDYCSYMGSEEEVKKHEPTCSKNYDAKNCHTCKHRKITGMKDMVIQYECMNGIDIPTEHIYTYCNSHEDKDEKYSSDTLTRLYETFGLA